MVLHMSVLHSFTFGSKMIGWVGGVPATSYLVIVMDHCWTCLLPGWEEVVCCCCMCEQCAICISLHKHVQYCISMYVISLAFQVYIGVTCWVPVAIETSTTSSEMYLWRKLLFVWQRPGQVHLVIMLEGVKDRSQLNRFLVIINMLCINKSDCMVKQFMRCFACV